MIDLYGFPEFVFRLLDQSEAPMRLGCLEGGVTDRQEWRFFRLGIGAFYCSFMGDWPSGCELIGECDIIGAKSLFMFVIELLESGGCHSTICLL